MTDTLRTRIAAVLNDSPLLRASIPIYERNWAEQLADAVIRELNNQGGICQCLDETHEGKHW